MTLLLYSCVQFIFLANAATGVLINCGSSVHGHVGSDARLSCNTSSPINELFWGVRSLEEPDPVLIVVDPGGVRPGTNIASTNYVNRVFFVGNKATGNASIEIKNLTLSDSKEYLWRIDHGGGLGYKRYTMSLIVTVPTIAPTSTIITTTDNQTTTTTPKPSTKTTEPTSKEFPTPRPEKWVTPVIVVCVILGIPFVVFVVILFCYLCCPQCLKKCCPRCFKWFEKWCPFCPKNHGNVSGDDQGKSPEPSGEAPTKSREEDIPMREKQNLP